MYFKYLSYKNSAIDTILIKVNFLLYGNFFLALSLTADTFLHLCLKTSHPFSAMVGSRLQGIVRFVDVGLIY